MADPKRPTSARARPLTERERRFVEFIFTEPTATDAARKAGYSGKNAKQVAEQMLKRPAVESAIKRRQKVLANRNIATAERVIEEQARIAFAKITDAVEWDADGVTPQASKGLPEEVAAAISEVSIVDDGVKRRIAVKMHPKQPALDSLARHFGIYNDKLKIESRVLDQVREILDGSDDDGED